MHTTILNLGISGERQTGITTLGVALINGLAQDERPVAQPLFVAFDKRSLTWTMKNRGLIDGLGTWAQFILDERYMGVPSLVVIDDCELYNPSAFHRLVDAILHRMSSRNHPTQIVLLRNPYHLGVQP